MAMRFPISGQLRDSETYERFLRATTIPEAFLIVRSVLDGEATFADIYKVTRYSPETGKPAEHEWRPYEQEPTVKLEYVPREGDAVGEVLLREAKAQAVSACGVVAVYEPAWCSLEYSEPERFTFRRVRTVPDA